MRLNFVSSFPAYCISSSTGFNFPMAAFGFLQEGRPARHNVCKSVHIDFIGHSMAFPGVFFFFFFFFFQQCEVVDVILGYKFLTLGGTMDFTRRLWYRLR